MRSADRVQASGSFTSTSVTSWHSLLPFRQNGLRRSSMRKASWRLLQPRRLGHHRRRDRHPTIDRPTTTMMPRRLEAIRVVQIHQPIKFFAW